MRCVWASLAALLSLASLECTAHPEAKTDAPATPPPAQSQATTRAAPRPQTSPAPKVQEPKPPSSAPAPALSLALQTKGILVVEGASTIEIPKVGGDYDMGALTVRLKELHAKYPKEQKLSIKADPAVPYSAVVPVLDICKATGFNLLSLTSSF